MRKEAGPAALLHEECQWNRKSRHVIEEQIRRRQQCANGKRRSFHGERYGASPYNDESERDQNNENAVHRCRQAFTAAEQPNDHEQALHLGPVIAAVR